MSIRKLFLDFVTVFVATLVASASVTLLWKLIVHGAGTIDWETSFRLAIILGLVLSWLEMQRSGKDGQPEQRQQERRG